MPHPSFRCSQEFLDRIREASEVQNVSMSDFIRTSVEHGLENLDQPSHNVDHQTLDVLREQLQAKDQQLEQLNTQLTQKDAQISELHQIVAMAQSNQANTLKQLEDAKVQRQRRWWQFWS